MSDIQKQVAQLESSVAALKVRVFDAQEVAGQYKEQAESLGTLIKELVSILKVETVDEQVTFEAILERARVLTAEDETVDSEG
ncbi:tail fiber chaperone [Escherichia phage EcS1]|uniref:Chaperone for long tail fiber formation n=1 Tax=Escherichia phage EcS1 TaxID=2083276 RepID=A0A2Z5ZCT1_9CAUD|nr:tail fiber chaperone [Escherichia phage EcS1]BBC78212.1 Chaperone for long tail fiber formation [Escherichia phage EcS1]